MSLLRRAASAFRKGTGSIGTMVLRAAVWTATRIEYFAVLGAIAVGTWAAWDVNPTAGKAVLAIGLLYLGGGISRLVKEVRGG